MKSASAFSPNLFSQSDCEKRNIHTYIQDEEEEEAAAGEQIEELLCYDDYLEEGERVRRRRPVKGTLDGALCRSQATLNIKAGAYVGS
ncbi:hypothetical protein Hanom_Chr09g00871801 [Helianthus anomalus]